MPTVGTLLVRDGRVLLGRRSAHKSFAHMWDMFGGHVEPGETPWAALCRELHEEIGVTDPQGDYITTLETDGPDGPVSLMVYAVFAWSGLPEIRDDEHVEIRWFDRDDIDQITNLVSDFYRPIIASLLTPPG